MNITLEQHPELKQAHDLLQVFPDAVIAGGVARDLINGKEFKDVDIFIPTPRTEQLADATMRLGYIGANSKLKPTIDDGYFGINSMIRIGLGNMDICMIDEHFNSPESLVNKFDMVLGQAWLVPTEDGFEVKATKLFHELNEKKVLGIYRSKAGGRENHIERICEKYSDYLPLELDEPRKEENFGVEFIPDF